ncbi:hypothetical protein DPQ33_17910 [Oceanidesulfovibrio indonesiensis]|uniref:Uncharacterized protein n=1 Tax=Oceanidesulfovibrio indonesiensis TaxID=54767 RepID=A0A7M3M9Z4_9BACT|nr:hypothetical protein [Oceanidesulfovibrio indonesiensis]TVM14041.1 hypothetical protein DPQ33_17910 [Oceanidesulfovibrio indonesiensis]
MKLLEINSSLGYFLDANNRFVTVDKITKEDLLRLADLVLTKDVEFDEYNEDSLKHQAHQIIYKSIYNQFLSLVERKQEFKDESERLYLEEYEKYKQRKTSSDNSPKEESDR